MEITQSEWIQIVTGFFGSFGFAIHFHIRGKKLLFAALGGFLSWTLFVLLKCWTTDEAIRYFLVSVLISTYAEGMARCLKTPTTTFLMTSLISLIPGGSLYYTMTAVFAGDWMRFLESGAHTLELSAALALGIVLVAAVAKLLSATAGGCPSRHED